MCISIVIITMSSLVALIRLVLPFSQQISIHDGHKTGVPKERATCGTEREREKESEREREKRRE